MGRGSADEAIVVVKLFASDDTVTYPRIKQTVSCMDGEAKGGQAII
jgi:hypothetical protein